MLRTSHLKVRASEKAIELEPDYAEAWYHKGTVLVDLGRSDEALKALEKATELKSDNAEVWYNRARFFSRTGQKERTIANLRRAMEIDPSLKDRVKKDEDFGGLIDDQDFTSHVE